MFSFIMPVSFLLIIISTARKDTSSITDMCGKDFVPYSLGYVVVGRIASAIALEMLF